MSKLFIHIYNYLERHTALRYLLLAGSFLLMLFFAVQVKFEEDVTRFFPDTQDARSTEIVFQNLKVKDKIIVMLSSADTVSGAVPSDRLIEAGDLLKDSLLAEAGSEYITDIFSEVDENMIGKVTDFIYDNLPVFLTEDDYARMDSVLTADGIERRMRSNYLHLLSPAGVALKSILPRDPVGLGTTSLEKLRDFQMTANYEIYDGHIFSRDMSTLLLFITPHYGTGSTGKNEFLIDTIEKQLRETMDTYPGVKAEYFGGPSVGVYNARQIKSDTMLTMTIALIIIIVFITLVFKSRSAVILIILPVLYGAVFSLALIYFLKGSVSAIAIGAGAAVFGVALSYSIHVLSHFNHVSSIRQLIEELAYPLTVGSFTTVGAFFGLVFTSSDLLRDFGLFSSLALIGTTFFYLVFLPHFLKVKEGHEESGRVLRFIEKINGYAYEKNKPLVITIVVVFFVSLYMSGKVTFDSNMMNLSFEPANLKAAEQRLNDLFQSDNKTTLFVSVGSTPDEGLRHYTETNRKLDSLKAEGRIKEFASAEKIFIPYAEQQRRIERWNSYWTEGRKVQVREDIKNGAAEYHFREDTFHDFFALLDKQYLPCDFTAGDSSLPLLDSWVSSADSLSMFITQVRLNEEDKETVYDRFAGNDGLVIFDRGYFANKWVSAINDDFYLILYISSFLIFFALLISYGRIELTLMTFTPMAVSWVIILGLMAATGTQFNIVNIILSTFIFGLGDDFSIFIMDGLQQEYRTGKKMLTSQKTAIFFSSFTAVVGLGVLVFAKHPALQSISVISILGMISVVLVSYTILPILFRFFISGLASRGNFPYTLSGLLVTVWFFGLFVVGCLLMMGIALLLILLPVKRWKKKQLFSRIMMYMLRIFLKAAWIARRENVNPGNETFEKPAVIIANHQSFVDILVMLSLAPKLVMVTNRWVWHSPVFGKIVQYADFVQTEDGYEKVLHHLRDKVVQGYSVVVFPEGTRSADCQVHRFHKGAFYLAEKLQLDILPVVLYGTGMIISKRQPFYVKRGVLCTRILPRILYTDASYGVTYQERSKAIAKTFRRAYQETCDIYSNPGNPYFYRQLVANYIYKGPVEEWYIRIKVRMEDKYDFFNRIVPRRARITDIGCGLGPLSYMLAMLSRERTVLGIDYDADKIAVANHNFSRNERIRFVCANVADYDLPESDVFVMNDMLHYMDYPSQERLLETCIGKLLPGGMLIIRDGDAGGTAKHRVTRFTELLSTRLLEFNKRENDLCFPTHEQFIRVAERFHLEIEQRANDRFTSNMIYILRKKEVAYE
ncbi:MAG: 1-acyl-sn-glycerol-3-phosphate acyltransferase [Parabacteroides gordonii]|nr:1-acyl-sn-glycerol-3-phosphate acyltransferase [Parabacteroides gordonii]